MDIRRALIVDDSKLVCFQLSKILKEKGIAAQSVNSGEEAVAYLSKNPLPDVIFIDIMMPGMDGYQTTEAIRSQTALAHLPIIMCSSNDSDEDRAQAKQRGANSFLPKPPIPEQITKAFASLTLPVKKTSPLPEKTIIPTAPTELNRIPAPGGENDLTHRLALELTKELTEKALQTISALVESDNFRQNLQRVLQGTAEKFIEQVTRNIVESGSSAAAEQIFTRTNTKPPTH